MIGATGSPGNHTSRTGNVFMNPSSRPMISRSLTGRRLLHGPVAPVVGKGLFPSYPARLNLAPNGRRIRRIAPT